MYTVPQEGDRVQEIGYEPRHGVLLETKWAANGWDTDAIVWWDGDADAHTINYEFIEMEHPE